MTTDGASDALPFGTISDGGTGGAAKKKKKKRKRSSSRKPPGGGDPSPDGEAAGSERRDSVGASTKTPAERPADERPSGAGPSGAGPSGDRPSGDRPSGDRPSGDRPSGDRPSGGEQSNGAAPDGERRGRGRRKRRRGKGQGQGQGRGQGGEGQRAEGQRGEGQRGEKGEGGNQQTKSRRSRQRNKDRGQRAGGAQQKAGGRGPEPKGELQEAQGMFVLDRGDIGVLRREESQFMPSKDDIYVSKNLIQKERLSEGSIITGRISRGHKHRWQLVDIQEIDGKPPGSFKNLTPFKNLTSIDPDFHYAVGDITDNVSMRVVDLLCPIGRGQRGLIVAPPRSGKTTIMREFAAGIEKGYPEVHLMILLVDERPEEATEWRRSVTTGKVFVSTADESAKTHIQLAEAVWKRACRLVELGEDVVVLLDSITRLARAYNNQAGPGRTMSGGLDSRAMERPRKIFGSARNTEEAGSLTILGTTLIETGSRLDQLVFEEFKGTGNMELVLSRKLADRRIFPAIDVERSGTRKEEKLVGQRRLKLIHTLRRVLVRMNFIEAMELLITRLIDVDKTDDFLNRFEVDPEA